MKKRIIYITSYDRKRIEELISDYRLGETPELKKSLNLLEGRLRRSESLDWSEIQPTVVTMNSRIRLERIDTNEKIDCDLVFPEDVNLLKNKISVLTDLGNSLLGRNVGDVIKVRSSEGVQHFVINAILYQPEANNDYCR